MEQGKCVVASSFSYSFLATLIIDYIHAALELGMKNMPINPFTVDFDYLTSLQLPERLFVTGSTLSFLRRAFVLTRHANEKST